MFVGQARLEFINIPLLRDYGLKPYLGYELAYYPSLIRNFSVKSLWKDTRHSVGFGLAIPLNNMIDLLIFYNALNFNSKRGIDFERRGLININLGFFWFLNKKV